MQWSVFRSVVIREVICGGDYRRAVRKGSYVSVGRHVLGMCGMCLACVGPLALSPKTKVNKDRRHDPTPPSSMGVFLSGLPVLHMCSCIWSLHSNICILGLCLSISPVDGY